ncbi:outer membrane protein [Falsirhodobacter halotolerans]|uniref:outer membrane protein n=1 Tax=Falsirhodobacter halotolerans TaxID=1146892 RepID=UPI001FD5656C|nr:outer membrane beta-barrel protein [Falsirhodobacter halotolerans]MCJ8139441.1 outer membrane beta-barrel protein [Falsirhodobacter halotolerans]
MARSIFVGTVVAAFAMPAFAGGPVVVTPEPVVTPVVVPPPPPSFAGGYVGAGLGYAFGADDEVGIRPLADAPGSFPRTVAGSADVNGAVANIHTGYRWQQPGSNFVYGVEAMFSAGEVSDFTQENGYRAESKIKWAGTLRGQLGYTVRPDTLLYGFAGYSKARSEYKVVGPLGVIDEKDDIDGYVVGLGLERMLNDRWSVRGEYEYANYGKDEYVSDTGVYRTEATPEFSTIRIGVNYNF